MVNGHLYVDNILIIWLSACQPLFIIQRFMTLSPNTRWVVDKFQQMPLQDYQRKRTDVFCTIVTILLAATLLSVALFSFNKDHLYKANFPADSHGRLCGVDLPKHHYIYFPNLEDITNRVCVRKCPQTGSLLKTVTSQDSTNIAAYQSEARKTRMGKFCFPTLQTARKQLVQDSQLFGRKGFLNSWDSIKFAVWFSVILGLIYVLLVQFCPPTMNWVGIIGGGIAALVLGIIVLVYRSVYFSDMGTGRVILGVILIILGVYLLASSFLRRREILLNGVFLNHATRVVLINWSLLFYIPFFLLLVLGLVALNLFQFFAVWSKNRPTFSNQNLFWQSQGGFQSIFWSILIAVQFFWGLSFLKQAFNFIVSGIAVNYYFRLPANCCQPFNRLITFHWGSVAAGSFMTGLFAIPDAIFDFFKPSNILSRYAKCYTTSCFWLFGFLDLVRSDAMAFIHLTGLAYCNSSRYCEYLSTHSPVFGGHQSISRLYRFGSHILLGSIVTSTAMYYGGQVNFWSVVFIYMFTYCIVTFFASLHADAADALAITFLAEEYLQPGGYQNVVIAPPGLTSDVTIALTFI